MAIHLLSIEHRLQEESAGCLAACAQMALNHLHIAVPQRQLNRLFGLGDSGTRFPYIQRLTRYNVQVFLQSGDDQAVKHTIARNVPAILFVRTKELTSYWNGDARHAVVVVGYDETHFYLNDPAFADAPQRVSIDEVMLAWLEFDYMYATVER